MSGRLKPMVALFVAVGLGLVPMSTVYAAKKSDANSNSTSRTKQTLAAGKKKQDAPPTLRRAAAKPAVAAKANKAPAAKKAPAVKKASLVRAVVPAAGVRPHEDRLLDVKSGAALVIEQGGGGALFEKNATAIVPIASITKLMTAMVVLDGSPDLEARVTVSEEDVDYLRGSRSRLQVGASMTRETALLLALMSSENRAAHALARHYPGGVSAFLAAMNGKAHSLGMTDTRFEDPTGLTSNNVSTAHDLAKMVAAAYRYPLIREFSTTPGAAVEIAGRQLEFHNTNPLVKSTAWDVGLSKTGYINEAGKCLVMQARVADRPVVIVLLDSVGKLTRVGDANRIKRWMETTHASRGGVRAQQASFEPRG